jgi:bacterioferritin-associated ferredoxin
LRELQLRMIIIRVTFTTPCRGLNPVYVCLCNALTDADIRLAAARDGLTRPAEVFAACRCRAQCGTCVRTVCGLIGTCLRAGRGADQQNTALPADTAALPGAA